MTAIYLLFILLNLQSLTFAKSVQEDVDVTKKETDFSDTIQNIDNDSISDKITKSSNETNSTATFDTETSPTATDKIDDKTTSDIVNSSTDVDESTNTKATSAETTNIYTHNSNNNYESYETTKKKNSNSKRPGNKNSSSRRGLKLLYSAFVNMLKGNKNSFNEPQEYSDSFDEFSDFNY